MKKTKQPLTKETVIRKAIAICIILIAGFLFSQRIVNVYNPKIETADGFYFDTYVTVAAAGENPTDTFFLFYDIEQDFKAAYTTKANELNSETLSDCISKTAELNRKYGDEVNLTCGELTALWGISTNEPKVPSEEEIQNALKSITDTSYDSFTGNTYLDFGSVAKGYACDCVKNQMTNYLDGGVKYYLLSMGSSALLYGKKPDGEQFKTAIKNPDEPDKFLGYVYTDTAFISTSGGYERYFEQDGVRYEHILDLTTGRPVVTDLTSVTVIVPIDTPNGGIMSDFLSTLIYMKGTEHISEYLNTGEFYVVACDTNRNLYVSDKLKFEVE